MEKLKIKYKITPFIPVVGFIFVLLNIKNYPNLERSDRTIILIALSAIIQGISVSITMIYLLEKYLT